MVVFKTKNSLLNGIFQISHPHATAAKNLEINSSNDVISQLGIGGNRGRTNGRRHGDPQVKLDLWMVSDLRCLFFTSQASPPAQCEMWIIILLSTPIWAATCELSVVKASLWWERLLKTTIRILWWIIWGWWKKLSDLKYSKKKSWNLCGCGSIWPPRRVQTWPTVHFLSP